MTASAAGTLQRLLVPGRIRGLGRLAVTGL